MKAPRLFPNACLRIGFLILGALPSRAGEVRVEKQVSLEQEWEFKLEVPSWLAGVYGDIGVNGNTSHVGIGVGKILQHLDFTAAFEAEARKGRFGFESSFLYLGASDNIGTGGLLSSVDAEVSQYLAGMSVSWRVIDTPRGWLDLLVGTRYVNLYQQVALHPDNEEIAEASSRLVESAGDRIEERLLGVISEGRFRDRIRNEVEARLSRGLDLLEGRKPEIPVGPLGAAVADRLRERIRDLLEARAARIASSLRTRAGMSAAEFREEVRLRVDAAKRDLEREIRRRIGRALNANHSKLNDWFDPYVGFRARYNLNAAFYLTAGGDIGGFGLGSDLTWQLHGAVGCQLSRRIYAEAGYRCLYINYRRGGLIYDVYTRGAQVTLGILF